MRQFIMILAALFLVQGSAMAATYSIDKDHSSIEFSVKHMGISNVKGSFKDYEGKIVMDDKAPTKDTANIKIKTSSIETGTAKRDEHLKSPDFFDVAKFPEMTFETTKVTKKGTNWTVDGKLKLHGVEKPVSLKATFGGKTTDPYGNERVAFSATGKIDRKEFGLTWNKPMNSGVEKVGGMMVGDDIALNFEIEAILDKDKAADKK
jgi:polyisoprenoid-binding protein YceI